MSERLQNFYSHYFGNFRTNELGEASVRCPFHEDNTESMSINVETGLWYCFVCDEGGDEYDFYMAEEDENHFPKVKAKVDAKFGPRSEEEDQAEQRIKDKKGETKIINPRLIRQWHSMLNKATKVKNYLMTERGLQGEILEKFEIGWDVERVTIPIKDAEGNYINVRRYSATGKGGKKMLSYKPGYGDAVLYPIENLDKDIILLTEGEMDCLLANQIFNRDEDIGPITCTGGAGTWKDDWNDMFEDKEVWISYDIDRAGQKGAEKIARKLCDIADIVKIVRLPIVDPPDGDLTDYFVSLGHTRDDFLKVVDKANPFNHQEQAKQDPGEKIHEVHLSEASEGQYHYKRIKMDCVVAGKQLAPYLIPKKMELFCGADRGKSCGTCGLGLRNGSAIVEFEPDDRDILQLIDTADASKRKIIKQKISIPNRCASFEMVETKAQNIEELYLIPELDFSDSEREYVVRKAYFIGHGLATNRSYTFEGITIPDPWNQYATHLLNKAIPSQDNVSTFTMDDMKDDRLEIFNPDEDQAIVEKFDEIHKDFTHNVTHIYGREDLLTAIDLVYHSALSFDFQGKRVKKGWLDALVIGDTRTGKSDSTTAMMNHYKMGEFVTGENSSFAGLIGGMQQLSNRWTITWGKIPLNDRRLVVIDEVSGLRESDIERMSGVRSSGVAEITKIQTERTHARTRLLWISNPRSGDFLNAYSYGIDAIKELIGKSEDVARFDFAITCASDEVPISEINKRVETYGRVEHKYTYDKCKELILWIWSRDPDQIKFTDQATGTILDYATKMGNQYSSNMPLVEGANQRIKLARISVAIAGRMYSTPDGEILLVKQEHVEYAYDYLFEIYKKQSLGYWDYSQQILEQKQKAVEAKGKVLEFLNKNPGAGDLFLLHNRVSGRDLQDILNIDRTSARRYLNFLAKNSMIRKTTSGYKKTPAYISILRDWKAERRAEENG